MLGMGVVIKIHHTFASIQDPIYHLKGFSYKLRASLYTLHTNPKYENLLMDEIIRERRRDASRRHIAAFFFSVNTEPIFILSDSFFTYYTLFNSKIPPSNRSHIAFIYINCFFLGKKNKWHL